ncbi:ferrous iron transport protein A [Methanoplanus sp. FWC-SCC4]|uniref:Ferrous iron transport protein A n=1 Tax=Methanochimaera problematica TaxID=2609417 RepID=A0AA97FEQ5_9EURY|nr:FeoA family protein [Methanoplanus sp. FWC-SCC4]WOF16923.1 ferrous iron transport protein A [Methanoplanus sp. FWC-SCC4]
MMLTSLKKNEQGYIEKIDGGEELKQRLSLRGIIKGARLKVINSRCGPVIVDINGSVLALGRGMAGKIIVERCSDD